MSADMSSIISASPMFIILLVGGMSAYMFSRPGRRFRPTKMLPYLLPAVIYFFFFLPDSPVLLGGNETNATSDAVADGASEDVRFTLGSGNGTVLNPTATVYYLPKQDKPGTFDTDTLDDVSFLEEDFTT